MHVAVNDELNGLPAFEAYLLFSHRALELASALDDDASIVLAYAQ
jgi:hypothetical protein